MWVVWEKRSREGIEKGGQKKNRSIKWDDEIGSGIVGVFFTMERGVYLAPSNYPQSINLRFHSMHVDHLRQFLVLHFGVVFLHEVEANDELLVLPILEYGA